MKQLPPIHPGEILLEDFMKPLGLSPSQVATALGVSLFRINQIVRSKRAITPEMALRLARYFGTSADIWLRLQVRYDLEVAKAQLTKQINREVKVLKVQAVALAG
jgi:addiction module HigA family antidote